MAPRSEVQIQARYAILTPAKMTLQKDFHTSIQTQSRNRVSPLNSSNHNEISKLKKKLSRKLSAHSCILLTESNNQFMKYNLFVTCFHEFRIYEFWISIDEFYLVLNKRK